MNDLGLHDSVYPQRYDSISRRDVWASLVGTIIGMWIVLSIFVMVYYFV